MPQEINPHAGPPKTWATPAAANTHSTHSSSRPPNPALPPPLPSHPGGIAPPLIGHDSPVPQERRTFAPDSEYVQNLNLPRPDSPTLEKLYRMALKEEIEGVSPGPFRPSDTVEMTRDQAKAAHKFKDLMEKFDPSGEKRAEGEFGGAFHGRKTTTPMTYAPGQGANMPMPLPADTTQVIHSHLTADPGTRNNLPSAADYYAAYLASQGNSNGIRGEMMYHPPTDQFYGYKGKIDPITEAPTYQKLILPEKARSRPPAES